MAAIAIVLSCAVGFLAGVVQFAFMDASLCQSFVTYVGPSVGLSAIAIGASILATFFPGDARQGQVSLSPLASRGSLENWHDWQTEEEMAAERHRSEPETIKPHAARPRNLAGRRSA